MPGARIVIEDYSPVWASAFGQLKKIYLTHLGPLIIDVQHVGSTAVPGLAAKPIIDIDLVIRDSGVLEPVIRKLEWLGYDHQGDLGITDRASFRRRSVQVPYDGSSGTWPEHNLYVCPSGSISLKNHIALRDFLRNNPEKARAYGELKKALALEDPFNINLYVERKTPFITAILKDVGFNDQAIDSITREN
ncbi:MAG TPA: GrpB family protein, partial [Chitinophagaceae bacterium]|nr:GrpB family protein [Chitinophagaceae bacterium]